MICDRKIPRKLKCKMYKCVIRPALLYGAVLGCGKEGRRIDEQDRDENAEIDPWSFA